jgi:hypothetical protein
MARNMTSRTMERREREKEERGRSVAMIHVMVSHQ